MQETGAAQGKDIMQNGHMAQEKHTVQSEIKDTADSHTYTIREMSRRYGLPASTLRYYEEIGLLCNVRHTDKGARIYKDEHIARLDGILCFKRTGLPIAKIQEFYRYEADIASHTGDILAMMTEQESAILRQMEELDAGLMHIREKILYYTEVQKAFARGEKQPRWEEVVAAPASPGPEVLADPVNQPQQPAGKYPI